MIDFIASLFSGVIFLSYGIFSLLVLVAIFVLASLGMKSSQRFQESEENITKMIKNIPADKQMVCLLQFNSAKKNPTTAYLLALFLGGIGAHKFYLQKPGLGIFYLLFCWTYIPAIIALIEVFLIAGQTADHNEKKAHEILMMFGM